MGKIYCFLLFLLAFLIVIVKCCNREVDLNHRKDVRFVKWKPFRHHYFNNNPKYNFHNSEKDFEVVNVQNGVVIEDESDEEVQFQVSENTNFVFSCTSSSNRRVKATNNSPVIVMYEKCPINIGKGFDKSSGKFVAKEPGSYDFSATFLMKADQSGSVIVSLKKGKITLSQTKLIADTSSRIGTTNSLFAVVYLTKGESVHLELEAQDRTSGLINSDWQLLKFNGYQRPETPSVLRCKPQIVGDDTLQLANCNANKEETPAFKSFDDNEIELEKNNFYKITLSADFATNADCSDLGISISETLDARSNFVSSVAATKPLLESFQGYHIPSSVLAYSGSDDNLLSHSLQFNLQLPEFTCDIAKSDAIADAHLEIVKEPSNAEIVICSNNDKEVLNTVSYKECFGSTSAMERSVGQDSGRFTAPKDGYYFITFSGTLDSDQGSRIWINICKKSQNQESVVGAGFTGLYHNLGKEPVEGLVLQTHPTITTIEKLKKNDQIWVSIGRNQAKSMLKTSQNNPALLTIKML